MQNTNNEKHDLSHCFVCGAKIKCENNSLHVWDIEYECGCKIWGAVDTEAYGNGIEINAKCPYDKE